MLEQFLANAAHYSPFVTWFMALLGLANLLLNYTKNRELRSGVVGQRRYWPWLLIVGLATWIAWGPMILASANLIPILPSQEMVPVGGTADANGEAGDVAVKIALNMPYEVFCTTNWNSSCYAREKKDGLAILVFNTDTPSDGGKVEWRAIPIPLLKAYHDEVNAVLERDRIIAQLRQQK